MDFKERFKGKFVPITKEGIINSSPYLFKNPIVKAERKLKAPQTDDDPNRHHSDIARSSKIKQKLQEGRPKPLQMGTLDVQKNNRQEDFPLLRENRAANPVVNPFLSPQYSGTKQFNSAHNLTNKAKSPLESSLALSTKLPPYLTEDLYSKFSRDSSKWMNNNNNRGAGHQIKDEYKTVPQQGQERSSSITNQQAQFQRSHRTIEESKPKPLMNSSANILGLSRLAEISHSNYITPLPSDPRGNGSLSNRSINLDSRGFQPYTLSDYQNHFKAMTFKFGGLGANTQTSEWERRKAAREKMLEFGAAWNTRNKSIFFEQIQKQLTMSSTEPDLMSRVKSKRERGLDFARQIELPKFRVERVDPSEEYRPYKIVTSSDKQ